MDNKNEIQELACDHKFHKNCINEWIKKNRTCPMCRRFAETKEERKQREKLEKEEREEIERKLEMANHARNMINTVLANAFTNSRARISPVLPKIGGNYWINQKLCIYASDAIDKLRTLGLINNRCIGTLERICLNIGIMPFKVLEIIRLIRRRRILDQFIESLINGKEYNGPRNIEITSEEDEPLFAGELIVMGKQEIKEKIIQEVLQTLDEINDYSSESEDKDSLFEDLIKLGIIEKKRDQQNHQGFGTTSINEKILMRNTTTPISSSMGYYIHNHNIPDETKNLIIRELKNKNTIQEYINAISDDQNLNSDTTVIKINKLYG